MMQCAVEHAMRGEQETFDREREGNSNVVQTDREGNNVELLWAFHQVLKDVFTAFRV